mmetsp:Transcript_1336/g.2662  ORF Transcript_1336/g.2662 Transcript_1336/m.2662 type:complete len:83 (+) Transcript_1336:47-295(+)
MENGSLESLEQEDFQERVAWYLRCDGCAQKRVEKSGTAPAAPAVDEELGKLLRQVTRSQGELSTKKPPASFRLARVYRGNWL